MLNDKENLQRTLFRLEQGKVMYRETDGLKDRQISVCSNPDFYMCIVHIPKQVWILLYERFRNSHSPVFSFFSLKTFNQTLLV